MNAKRLLCAIAATTGLAVSGLVTSVGPAAAAPIEHEHFRDVSSEVVDPFCGDLRVRIDTDLRGSLLIKPQGPDELVYFLESVHGTISYTNLTTNKSFTSVLNFLNKDLKVTDNGDGTLTVLAMFTGVVKHYGPDGRLLFVDSGQIRIELVIDHGGTPTDPADDVVLDDTVVKPSNGRNDTEGRDFCTDMHLFTS